MIHGIRPSVVIDVLDVQLMCQKQDFRGCVGVGSYRLAIQSKGDINVMLSAQHLLSCIGRHPVSYTHLTLPTIYSV